MSLQSGEYALVNYGIDNPYLHGFIRELAPAWLDHVALVSGIAPPARENGFSWCDLGCGQGVTATILAGTNPLGRFCGIDAMPKHIDHAQRFAKQCAVNNANFQVADFGTAARTKSEGFDYIVSHGVYSWVDNKSKASLRCFIDRHLKPGGLVYISYYAMPGRAADLPFQRLVRAIGHTLPGDSATACAAALDIVDKFIALKAPALLASPFAFWMKEQPEFRSYLSHDLMATNWDPLCVTEVRAEMRSIGLEPVGSARFIENYNSLVLGSAERELLASIADENTRELARDYLINQFFRLDVFVRKGRRLDEQERRERLLRSTFALTRPASLIEYSAITPAGRLKLDNAVARSIVAALVSGPMPLINVATRAATDPQDILASALVLCATKILRPVESGRAEVARINDAIRQRLNGPEEILHLALPYGTTLKINDALRAILQEREHSEQDKVLEWQSFLKVCLP